MVYWSMVQYYMHLCPCHGWAGAGTRGVPRRAAEPSRPFLVAFCIAWYAHMLMFKHMGVLCSRYAEARFTL